MLTHFFILNHMTEVMLNYNKTDRVKGFNKFELIFDVLQARIPNKISCYINTIIERGRYSSQEKLGTVAGYKRS